MTKDKSQLQSWQVYLFLGIVLVAVVLGVVQMTSNNGDEAPVDNQPPVVLTAASCAAAGGSWNACGSACRGMENEDACISLCVEYCECKNDSQCPYGFSCTDIIEEIGVCTNTR